MTLQAYCPYCEKKVTALTVLAGNALKLALDSIGDVRVIHTTNAGDHVWHLDNQEKENLRNRVASGDIALGASS